MQVMAEAPQDVARLQEHPDYALAVPTPDHFLPLLYMARVAAVGGAGAGVPGDVPGDQTNL